MKTRHRKLITVIIAMVASAGVTVSAGVYPSDKRESMNVINKITNELRLFKKDSIHEPILSRHKFEQEIMNLQLKSETKLNDIDSNTIDQLRLRQVQVLIDNAKKQYDANLKTKALHELEKAHTLLTLPSDSSMPGTI